MSEELPPIDAPRYDRRFAVFSDDNPKQFADLKKPDAGSILIHDETVYVYRSRRTNNRADGYEWLTEESWHWRRIQLWVDRNNHDMIYRNRGDHRISICSGWHDGKRWEGRGATFRAALAEIIREIEGDLSAYGKDER